MRFLPIAILLLLPGCHRPYGALEACQKLAGKVAMPWTCQLDRPGGVSALASERYDLVVETKDVGQVLAFASAEDFHRTIERADSMPGLVPYRFASEGHRYLVLLTEEGFPPELAERIKSAVDGWW